METAFEQNFNYFLGSQFKEFKEGEWVAIHNKKIISHGENLKKVISEAQKITPISQVLLSKIKRKASYLKQL